jgi:hypothetical protein
LIREAALRASGKIEESTESIARNKYIWNFVVWQYQGTASIGMVALELASLPFLFWR